MLDYITNMEAPYSFVESSEVIRDAQRLLVGTGPPAYLLADPESVDPGHGVRSILQLRGLGREVWADVAADTYVQALRNEWPTGK